MNALLEHHRVLHRQRILVEMRLFAVPVALVDELGKPGRADHLLRHQLAQLLRDRQKAKVEPHGQRRPTRARQVDDLHGLFEFKRQRLLCQQRHMACQNPAHLVQTLFGKGDQHDCIVVARIQCCIETRHRPGRRDTLRQSERGHQG